MKLLQVYNDYRSACGGEAGVVRMTAAVVEKHGDTALLLSRTSKGIDDSLAKKVRCFFSSIYSLSARREMARLLAAEQPDVVHVHNLYPLLSPSVLVACRRAGVPVVMTNHNYLLTCPIVSHLREGRVCEKCLGGREYQCVRHNCRQNMAESVAYAIRSVTARKLHFFRDLVTVHIVLSNFAKQRLVDAGYEEDRIVVLPNMVEFAGQHSDNPEGDYVAYSGRMAPEKGIDVLLAAMARLPEIEIRLAGSGPIQEKLVAAAPPNAEFLGRLDAEGMRAFYRNARFLVIPSMWFEGCPLVVSEAMSHGLPVIASRIGGLPELIDDDVTGLLFEPGNVAELTEKIRLLWHEPALCRRMGQAASAKAAREYGEQAYYPRLLAVYNKARALCGKPALPETPTRPALSTTNDCDTGVTSSFAVSG